MNDALAIQHAKVEDPLCMSKLFRPEFLFYLLIFGSSWLSLTIYKASVMRVLYQKLRNMAHIIDPFECFHCF